MEVLITGITGFIGTALLKKLVNCNDFTISGTYRSSRPNVPKTVKTLKIKDLSTETALSSSLNSINTVIHTAARAHIMRDSAISPIEEYRRVNVDGTVNLAKMALQSGVKRFIFLSSVKVNGEETQPHTSFSETTTPSPVDPYGISKYEAENELKALAENTSMEIVIIRLPLVYGSGVKGNFQTLLSFIRKGIPLPLASIRNKRSFIGIDNLIDFIALCIKHPDAANQTFFVSDGEDISTPDLLFRAAKAINRPLRLFPFPVTLLEFGANLIGKKTMAQRLCKNLQVDMSKTQKVLGWSPPLTVDEGLLKTVKET